MVNPFEYIPDGVGDDRPTIVQLKEYRDLMVDIVRRQGKGIRYARQGERARTRIGTEYLLPGSLTEWSEPDKKFRTKIMRDRLYSASFRTDMGANAGRLLVLEGDSVRVGDAYETRRNMFRFTWADPVGIYQAEVLPIRIISDAQTDAEIIQAPNGAKQLLALDHERTVNAAHPDVSPGYYRYINPLRDTESPWKPVTEADFDALTMRTDIYGRELLDGFDLQAE